MRVLAKIDYDHVDDFKKLLVDNGLVVTKTYTDTEAYAETELFSLRTCGKLRFGVDRYGNVILPLAYIRFELNITEEELTYLKLKVSYIHFEVIGDNDIRSASMVGSEAQSGADGFL